MLQERLNEIRSAREEHRSNQPTEAQSKRRGQQRAARDKNFLKTYSPGAEELYLEWLEGYAANGGEVHGIREEDIAVRRFVVWTNDLEVRKFASYNAMNILVPVGVESVVRGATCNHTAYWLEDFSTNARQVYHYEL